MRLFKITTKFLGKDLNKEVLLGYLVVENGGMVFDHINEKYNYGEWPEAVDMTREAIIEARGDDESEYMGEFYDQKYGWEDLGEISDDDIAHLKRLKIIAE